MESNKLSRRKFMKQSFLASMAIPAAGTFLQGCDSIEPAKKRIFNAKYENDYLSRIAFPVGGMGAGMLCIEGSGAISHVSVRHRPEIFHEPCMFAAIHVKGIENGTKLLEGQSPHWKRFGLSGAGNGLGETSWGLPRFSNSDFLARFPFAEIDLQDKKLPLDVHFKGWSPFIPSDEDNSSLPVGAIEYTFRNTGSTEIDAIFSYNSRNFMHVNRRGSGAASIDAIRNGFVLSQAGTEGEPFLQSHFAIFTDEQQTKVNHHWFRGGWFDPLTICWNDISSGSMPENKPVETGAPGASLFVPFKLKANETKTIRLYMAWFVPFSNIKLGEDAVTEADKPIASSCCDETGGSCCPSPNEAYRPWYSSKFNSVNEVASYWLKNYDDLKAKTQKFTDAFYASTLPSEVLEAVSANLGIIKSPSILRQYDGRLWGWEGCNDNSGCCHGSCTHVWNYAQAIAHLFPAMERTLRETEFCISQNKEGHQAFRAALPVRPVTHKFHSAADGQLGGIMKIYRDWRISGDTNWIKGLFPNVLQSMDFCIKTWDPKGVGALEEPHHNTYDIEFWGPDGMCTSFYIGALQAVVLMGKALNEDVTRYETLMAKSKNYLETKLYDGEYFIQDIRWKDLEATDPTSIQAIHGGYSEEALNILEKEGPKYQYGTGCLSDGVLGSWLSLVCGMPEIMNKEKVKSHLCAIHKYNLKEDLSEHSNPQRPTYAMGNDAGLLLCTWPKGGKLSLPFVYSNEVWTGIEYQVASHLMFEGETEKGLDIVRACRSRYDGRVRDPFNEYECGSYYIRALASYGLLEGLTGIRFDAVEGTLYIDSRIGNNFTSFLSTNTGFGNAGLKNGKPFIDVKQGAINVKKCVVAGKEEAFIS